MYIHKALTRIIIFSMLMLFAAASAFAAAQTTCPVMGGAINKDIYSDYKGERVYFCCGGCPPQFEQNPEKYLNKLKEMGQEPEKIQATK